MTIKQLFIDITVTILVLLIFSSSYSNSLTNTTTSTQIETAYEESTLEEDRENLFILSTIFRNLSLKDGGAIILSAQILPIFNYTLLPFRPPIFS